MQSKSNIIFLLLFTIFINKLFAHEITSKKNKLPTFTKKELEYIQTNRKIKVGMMSNFKPFSFFEKGQHQGFAVDLLNKISNISGLDFEVTTDKWNKNLNKFKSNQLDIVTGISHTKKREHFTLFSKSYYEVPTYIFGLKDGPNYTSIKDLKGKKVAISFSMYYKDELLKNGINVIEYNNSREKALSLVIGDVDYFLASYTSGKNAIIEQSFTSIKPLDEFKGVKKEDLRFGVNKNNPILFNIINKSLAHISKDEINKLKHKWIFELKIADNYAINLTNKEKDYLLHKDHINLCIDPNWMPFEKIDNNGKHIGLSSEYFKIFQEKLNIPIKLIQTKSWIESLAFIKNSKCDLLSLALKTPVREKHMEFTKPYLTTPLVLATKFNVPFIDEISNLKDKQIGIVKGYTFKSILKEKYPELNIVSVENIDEGLKKVSNSELFGFIDTLPTIVYNLQTNFLGDLKIGAKFNEKWDLSIAVNKDAQILINIFDKLIYSIPENKKQEILNKYISISYEKPFDYELFWKISIFILFIFLFLIYRQYIQNKNNEQLKESYNKIQTILDTTMEGIVISKNGIIIDVNQEILKLFKYETKDELIGHKVIEFISEASMEDFIKNFKIDFTKPYELQLIKSNKETFYGLIRGKNIKTKDANFRVSTLMDLTNIKEKEALIIQQSKVTTAGEMLENISHQWRQPLSQISTISTGIKVQKEFGIFDDKNLISDMENINNSAQYLSQTIEDFKSFLKPNVDTNELFDLQDTINKFRKLTKDVFEYNNIKMILETKSCEIKQNENLLIQALLNISNNSKDAILEHNDTKLEDSYLFISLDYDGNNAVITLRDNGGGIKKEILNRIFEPYFTTKHESMGTGIGLYMTYQIIKKQLQGNITVKNIEYTYNGILLKGAEFTITLPLKKD